MNQQLLDRLAYSGVFVTGHERSGTTLMITLLDSHPELAVYTTETHFFSVIQSLYRSSLNDGLEFAVWNAGRDLERFLKLPTLQDRSEQDVANFRQQMRSYFAYLGGDLAALLPALILAFNEALGSLDSQVKYWVEKTPGHEHFCKKISKMFPAARIVHMIRDPRAIYPSYQRSFKLKTQQQYLSLIWFCAKWKESVAACNVCQKALPVLTIRYEDLLLEPRPTMETVADFLGIEFHESLMQPTRAGAPFKGNSAYAGFGSRTNFSGIDSSPLNKWQTILSEEEQRIICYLLAPEMQAMGYIDNATMPADISWIFKYQMPFEAMRLIARSPDFVKRWLKFLIRGDVPLIRWNEVHRYRIYKHCVQNRLPSDHSATAKKR